MEKAELCRCRGHDRVIGPVRFLQSNFTQFPESLAQLVGSGGGNIIGMEMYIENIQNTGMQCIIHKFQYIHYLFQYTSLATLSFAGGSEQTVYVLTTLFEFFDIHNEG